MVKEGYYFGVPPLVLGGGSYLLHWYAAAAVLVFLALFVFSFFRDPDRVIPAEPGAVVSPADGRVVVVTEEENAGRPGQRLSVFLAIWRFSGVLLRIAGAALPDADTRRLSRRVCPEVSAAHLPCVPPDVSVNGM